MSRKPLEVMPKNCDTCPFIGTGWTEVRGLLETRALTTGTPICHSTGRALIKRLGKAKTCRGARDFQLTVLHRIGFLEAPTDAAWQKKFDETQTQTQCSNPTKT